MALPRQQQRLFAHHALAFDVVDRPAPIGDPPMPGQQLDRFVRAVFDPDVIDPEPLAHLNLRLIGQKTDRDTHGDALGNRGVLEKLFHRPVK